MAQLLTCIRHAKSSWKDSRLADHDRPLARRGRKAAPRMATWLRQHAKPIDVLYTSSAVRARQTADYFQDLVVGETVVVESLYTFDDRELMKAIQDCDLSAAHIAIVGHNPALTATVNSLARSEIENIPTAGVACLALPVATSPLAVGQAELVAYQFPKGLGD